MATRMETEDVQIFDVWESLKQGTVGRNDMATGAFSYVAIFDTLPKQGELSVHQHPDSDQILFVLRGECSTQGLQGGEVLTPQEGVLIPAGSYYAFANTGEGDLKFLSMRTESTGGRHIRYVADQASGVRIKIPRSSFGADAETGSAEVYVLDHRTIAVSPVLIPEWNRSCVLRSSCAYVSVDDDVVIELPQRVASWYELSALQAGRYRVVSMPGKRDVLIELPFSRGGDRAEAAALLPQRPPAEAGRASGQAQADLMEPRDEVQVFRLGELLRTSGGGSDQRTVAHSSNSRIAMVELASGQSNPDLGAQDDCEQILFVLDGECSLACEAGEFRLRKDQGFLVAAGASYAVSNPGTARTALLWMRTEAAADEHAENFSSDLRIKLPKEALKGLSRHIFLYTLTRRTIGVSFSRLLDWDQEALVRLHAPYEVEGDDIWFSVPQRVAQWYGLRELTEDGYRFLPDGEEKSRGRIELLT